VRARNLARIGNGDGVSNITSEVDWSSASATTAVVEPGEIRRAIGARRAHQVSYPVQYQSSEPLAMTAPESSRSCTFATGLLTLSAFLLIRTSVDSLA
jgi:hypothetical protein